MSKSLNLLLLAAFLLVLLAGCATVEPTAAVEPNNLVQEETQSTQTVEATQPVASNTPAAPAQVQPPNAAPADPQMEGQSLLEQRCAGCHTLDRVSAQSGLNADWEAIVSRMILKGANLSDEEKAILVQFLAENYK